MLLPLLFALSAQAADTARLVIVATTDVHGRATGWDYVTDTPHRGGIARAATIIDSLRRVHPGQVVAVDAGDLIQGDPFGSYFGRIDDRSPHPVIEAMNLAGYDVLTPGNHEFNFGIDVLRRAIASARFSYVSGNILRLPARERELPASVVLERGGVRVGVTGFTTPGVMVWDRENVRDRMVVTPVFPAAEPIVRDLNRQADFTLVVIHSGMDGSSSFQEEGVGRENVAAQFATIADRPHLVVVGHSHRQMTDSVINGVHFMQPRPYAQSLAIMKVVLVREGGRWRVASQRGEQVDLANVPVHPGIEAALAEAHTLVRQHDQAPIGEALGTMSAATARAEATAIINWVNEVQRTVAGTQLSSTAPFDPRAAFPAGPVRRAQVAQLYPYENTLRAVRISGDRLKAYLEQSARYFDVRGGSAFFSDTIPGYNYDIVWGAEYAIDLTRPVGSRIVGLSVDGRPVTPADTFTMALNNYRQGGGGGFGMLAGLPQIYNREENIRDLLVDDLLRRGRLDPSEFAVAHWRIEPEHYRDILLARATGRPVPGWETTALRVFTTNDFHGAVEPRVQSWSNGRPVGGAAAIKAWMDSSAAACRCPTLRLDGGDQMQGTLQSNLTFGRPVVESFNALGLDAAVIGNHDLDWGPDTLRARMRQARYPWLAANLFDSTTGRRPDWVRPWTLIEKGRFRIAVVGYMLPGTKAIVKPEFTANLALRGGREAIADVMAEVRAATPDLTIIVAHEGGFCDEGSPCRGDIFTLARSLDSTTVDLIVAGHSHSLLATRVNGIPIIQARSSGTAVGVADLYTTDMSIPGGRRLWRLSVPTVYADGVRDTAVATIVARHSAAVAAMANQPVTELRAPLGRDGDQYPLGHIAADAIRAGGRAQVGFVNTTGVRAPLAAGVVTYEHLFLVHPFGNRVVRATMTGALLRRALEHSLGAEGRSAVTVHVSGITVEFDASRPVGSRITALRLADGAPITATGRYTVATLDYLAQGGSGYTMLTEVPWTDAGDTDIDNLVAYLRGRPKPLVAPTEPRIRPAASR